MKKRIFHLILLSVITISFASAQVRIGIKGGINAAQLKSNDEFITPNPSPDAYYRITIPKHTLIGYHVGLMAQFQISALFIQPEVIYTVTKNDINIYDLNGSNPTMADEIKQKLNRLEIPVIVGLKLGAFKAGVGPVLTFLISDDSDLKKITEYDLQLNKATMGYQAGIGLDFKHLTFDARYSGSLSKISDGIKLNDNQKINFDSRLNQFIFSVGLFF